MICGIWNKKGTFKATAGFELKSKPELSILSISQNSRLPIWVVCCFHTLVWKRTKTSHRNKSAGNNSDPSKETHHQTNHDNQTKKIFEPWTQRHRNSEHWVNGFLRSCKFILINPLHMCCVSLPTRFHVRSGDKSGSSRNAYQKLIDR